MPPESHYLREIRFSSLQLRLEMTDDFSFELPALLQLRRELRQATDLLALQNDAGGVSRLLRLLKPDPFQDPVARRRFRQPAPAFVFGWPESGACRLLAGDELLVPVSLWGRGRSQFGDLLRLFDTLGQIGLHHGQGRFSVQGVDALAGSDFVPVWRPGEPLDAVAIPYSDLDWWLEAHPVGGELQMEFVTPARVLSNNRPLFRPQPVELFTAMLRRVTGMVYAWSGIELPVEPRQMMAVAAGLQLLDWSLTWRDWRSLTGDSGSQDLGGLLGTLRLGGSGLEEVGWVFRLSELFTLGRGAAYGGGCCRVGRG